jgi:hypothetical protein
MWSKDWCRSTTRGLPVLVAGIWTVCSARLRSSTRWAFAGRRWTLGWLTAPSSRLILDERDKLLLDALASIHEQRRNEPIEVAVVYGAAHMRAVVHYLSIRFGYRPADADWLDVFEL